MAQQKDRLSVDISDIKERIESCRNDPAWGELSLTGKVRTLLIQELIRYDSASSPTPAGGEELKENYQLLVSFLVYLIQNFDHDGFSLAEISHILGLPSDKDLVDLVAVLRDSRKSARDKKLCGR